MSDQSGKRGVDPPDPATRDEDLLYQRVLNLAYQYGKRGADTLPTADVVNDLEYLVFDLHHAPDDASSLDRLPPGEAPR